MPTLIAGVVAVIVLYSLLQMFRAANPVVLARAIKIGGGVVALAVAAFTGIKGELAVAIPLGIFGAGLLGWSPFGDVGFRQYRRDVRRLRRTTLAGTDVAGPLAVSRHDARSRQRRAFAARSWPGRMPATRSSEFDLPQLIGDDLRASTPKACRYLKAIWTAGFPPGVRTRRETRQGGRAARRRAAK